MCQCTSFTWIHRLRHVLITELSQAPQKGMLPCTSSHFAPPEVRTRMPNLFLILYHLHTFTMPLTCLFPPHRELPSPPSSPSSIFTHTILVCIPGYPGMWRPTQSPVSPFVPLACASLLPPCTQNTHLSGSKRHLPVEGYCFHCSHRISPVSKKPPGALCRHELGIDSSVWCKLPSFRMTGET